MAMLEDAKQRLRITINAFDDEIQDLIDAGVADLVQGGVLKSIMDAWVAAPDNDKLLKRAVMIYVKNHFGWDNPDFDKLDMSYKTLKGEITLSDKYIKEVI
jgi:hypothetical protein